MSFRVKLRVTKPINKQGELMDTQIVAVFCLVDDMLKTIHYYEDPQTEMGDAEVMTTAIIAMLYFGGNYTHARKLLASQGYVVLSVNYRLGIGYGYEFHRPVDG